MLHGGTVQSGRRSPSRKWGWHGKDYPVDSESRMTLRPLIKNGLKVLAVSGVTLLGYVMHDMATAPPDRWADNLGMDQDLAESHCNGDYQCEGDLKVALSGCIAVHQDDSIKTYRDNTYLCQYRYMAKLGVRLPVKGKDGTWVDGNLDEILTRLSATTNCITKHPTDKMGPGPARDAELDAFGQCLASYPRWRAP